MHYIIFFKSWSILYQFILSIISREIHLSRQKKKETIRLWQKEMRLPVIFI